MIKLNEQKHRFNNFQSALRQNSTQEQIIIRVQIDNYSGGCNSKYVTLKQTITLLTNTTLAEIELITHTFRNKNNLTVWC